MGQAETLREGFKLAQDMIRSGQAIAKLKDWVRAQNTDPENGIRKLEQLLGEVEAPQEVL